MSLPGKYYLHRMPSIIEDSLQPFFIKKYQIRPLVGGETSGETYGQSIWLQESASCNYIRWADPIFEPSLPGPIPDVVDQFNFQVMVNVP